GDVPDDLIGVTIRLTAWMLVAAGIESAIDDAEAVCRARLDDGSAYERFMKNVELQGGDPAELERQIGSRRAAHTVTVDAPRGGYVTQIDAYAFGLAGVGLGVGRNKTSDAVRPDVGFELYAKQGDRVVERQPLYTIYADNADAAREAAERLDEAYTIDDIAIVAVAPVVEEHAAL
ncbi:MAG: thymidine phosphorylase, partial [Spirochaetaceae bacterium]